MCATPSDHAPPCGTALAGLVRLGTRTLFILGFTCLLLSLVAPLHRHAVSSAYIGTHGGGQSGEPSSSGYSASAPSSSSSYDSSHRHHSRESSVRSTPSTATTDEQKIRELLSSLYSQMHKYNAHGTQSAELTSSSSASESTNLNLDNHLIAERAQEFLKDVDYANSHIHEHYHHQQQQPHLNNRQENLKSNAYTAAMPSSSSSSSIHVANFKKNGKAMTNTEQETINKLVNIAAAAAGGPEHYQPMGVTGDEGPSVGVGPKGNVVSSEHLSAAVNGNGGGGGGGGPVVGSVNVPSHSAVVVNPQLAAKHKLQNYVQEKQQRSTLEDGGGREELPVAVANKYLSALNQSGQRKQVAVQQQQQQQQQAQIQQQAQVPVQQPLQQPLHNTEQKTVSSQGQMNVQVGVVGLGGNSQPVLSSSGHSDDSIFDMLNAIDSRVQKLQDTMVYYRNTPTVTKPPPVQYSSNGPLNPIITNYLSLIKAQVMNIESMIEAKFSNIEHKFSNVEVEESIWKKTINWKLEEMSSKLSQNENKLSFSNEQIMNKLELFERNFQLVTNDFFAKFLLINEKLNKVDLTLQTKWNDLDVKLRNTFAESFKQPPSASSHHTGGGGGGARQHNAPGSIIYGKHEMGMDAVDRQEAVMYKESYLAQQQGLQMGVVSTQHEHVKGVHMQNNPEYGNQMQQQHVTHNSGNRKVVEVSKEQQQQQPNTSGKQAWNSKQMTIKPNQNVTNLSDRIKLHSFQRFIKLMNSKTNQTLMNGMKPKFNSTNYIDLMNTNAVTVGPNMVNNDAPAVDGPLLSSTSTSPRPTDRPPMAVSPDEASTTTRNHGSKPSAGGDSAHRGVNGGSLSKQSNISAQAVGINNRNLDSLEGVNYAEMGHTTARNLTATIMVRDQPYQAQHQSAPHHTYINKNGQAKQPPLTDEPLNLARCEHLFSMLDFKKEPMDEANFVALCHRFLDSAPSGLAPSLAVNAQENPPYHNGGGNQYHQVESQARTHYNQSIDDRESILEKRHLSGGEEIIVDQHKDNMLNAADQFAVPQLNNPQMNVPISQQYVDSVDKQKTEAKLEELDSKLQFFSTKIIKIVQEMWLSSQSSENYLKQSLSVANKTNTLLTEEFAKLQASMKPVAQMSTLAEEIREPILNRLQELSTSINNSVEVILNTQSEFISSCRSLREEEVQIYDVLEFLINEVRNRTLLSANALVQVNRNLQDQNGQFNRSLEFMLYKLDALNKKTVDGVRAESIKMMDIMKGELSQLSMVSTPNTGGGAHGTVISNGQQSFLAAAQEMSKSTLINNGQQQQAQLPACNNECFITKEEFANICINIDPSRQLFHLEPEPMTKQQHQHQQAAHQQQHQSATSSNVNNQSINMPQAQHNHQAEVAHPSSGMKGQPGESGPEEGTVLTGGEELLGQVQHPFHGHNNTQSADETHSSGQIEINNGNSEN